MVRKFIIILTFYIKIVMSDELADFQVIETPQIPIVELIDSTSIRTYIYGNEKYIKNNRSIAMELSAKNENNYHSQTTERSIKNVNGTSNVIYYTVFRGLTAGITYSIKSKIIVNNETNPHKVLYSNETVFRTPCNWDKNFEIITRERSISLKKILNDESTCSDLWQHLESSKITLFTNEELIRITEIEKFPLIIDDLIPAKKYNICIKGINDDIIYCKQISTLKTVRPYAMNLKVNTITSTEVELSWNSMPNSDRKVYNLKVEVLYYKGCKSRKNTPAYLLTSTSISNINPLEVVLHKLTNLRPYVSYQVTVTPYNNSELRSDNRIIVDTKEQEVPTAIFNNISFKKNVITWTDPVDCWTITGPIMGARISLYGLSEYVKDFYDQHDTKWHLFTLSEVKIHKIYANEKYLARIHVLRKVNGTINETAFDEISFITDPGPPPKRQNFEIVGIDKEKQTTTIRWRKPSSSITIDGGVYYIIEFRGKRKGVTNLFTVFPNETCYLWPDFLCKTVFHPGDEKGYIKITSYNSDQFPAAPDLLPAAPEITTIVEEEPGIVYLQWRHPTTNGVPVKMFLIHQEIVSTQLIHNQSTHDVQVIEFPISKYDISYDTHLYLLPSTFYVISVQGKGEWQIGKVEIAEIETKSSMVFEYEPYLVPRDNESLVDVLIPPIINETINSKLHIVVKGPSICRQGGKVESSLEKDIGVNDNEVAWRITTFLSYKAANISFTIGDDLIYDGVSNCPLHKGSTYIIVLAVREDRNGPKESESLIWKSQPFQIGPHPNQHYELWAIPLALSFVAVGLILYIYLKRRNERKSIYENKSSKISEPMYCEIIG